MALRSIVEEHDKAMEIHKFYAPMAKFWRGDVRLPSGAISPGHSFNLVDDANPNRPKTLGQFRALSLVVASEGYIAIEAVESIAVPSQLPTVLMSHVIKSTPL